MLKLKKILKEQHVSSTIEAARDELKQKGANDELITAIESWTKDDWIKIKRTQSNWYNGKYVGSPGANPNSSYNVYLQDIQAYRNVYNSEQIGESYMPKRNKPISLKKLLIEQLVFHQPSSFLDTGEKQGSTTSAIKNSYNFDTLLWELKVKAAPDKGSAGSKSQDRSGLAIAFNKWDYGIWDPTGLYGEKNKEHDMSDTGEIVAPGSIKTGTANDWMEYAKILAKLDEQNTAFDVALTDKTGVEAYVKIEETGDWQTKFKDFYSALDWLVDQKGHLIEYLRPYNSATSHPSNTISKWTLLRDNETVYVMDEHHDLVKGKFSSKTQWTDSNTFKKYPENVVWDNSVYVGDPNIGWLNKIPNSEVTKKKIEAQASKPTETDSLAVKFLVGLTHWEQGNLNGTNDVKQQLLVNSMKTIQTRSQWDALELQFKRAVTAYNKSDYGTYDFFFFNHGKVTHKDWYAALPQFNKMKSAVGLGNETAEDIAREIAPYMITVYSPNGGYMKQLACVPDSVLKGILDWVLEDGFYSMVRSVALRKNSNRDQKILQPLIKAEILGYDKETNSAVFPGGDKMAFYSNWDLDDSQSKLSSHTMPIDKAHSFEEDYPGPEKDQFTEAVKWYICCESKKDESHQIKWLKLILSNTNDKQLFDNEIRRYQGVTWKHSARNDIALQNWIKLKDKV